MEEMRFRGLTGDTGRSDPSSASSTSIRPYIAGVKILETIARSWVSGILIMGRADSPKFVSADLNDSISCDGVEWTWRIRNGGTKRIHVAVVNILTAKWTAESKYSLSLRISNLTNTRLLVWARKFIAQSQILACMTSDASNWEWILSPWLEPSRHQWLSSFRGACRITRWG